MRSNSCAARSPRAPVSLGFALWLAGLGACGANEGDGPRPDVVLIVIDTLRADRLGCYGYPRPTSPNLDALAAEGVLFEDVISQASWTLVSMTSMWGGRYVTDNLEAPDPEWPVLAEAFRDAGYRTLGRSANPLLATDTGFARGFDDYGSYGEHGGLPGNPRAERLIGDLWQPLDRALATDGDGRRPPLFLYLQPFDPHTPYERHPEYDDVLPSKGAPPFEPLDWHQEQLELRGPPPSQEDPQWKKRFKFLREKRGTYEQEIRYLDHHLGVLFEGLRSRGVLERAVVAIVADHGEELWDHVTPLPEEELAKTPPEFFFFRGHGYSLHQDSIRTPFILWGEGIPPGLRLAHPVENVDLFPTLLELARVRGPERLDGRSLVPAIRGDGVQRRRYLFSFVRQVASVQDRETGLKLVEPTEFGRKKNQRQSLFHLPSDPLERHDLASERPEEVARLQAVLADWVRAHPTRADAAGPLTEEQRQRMIDLGYTGDHSEELDQKRSGN